MNGGESHVSAISEMDGTWAVSFGMPSAEPDIWRRDMEVTRKRLARGQILVASVVGTMQPDWTLEDLAEDYAQCAVWALESGADVVETMLVVQRTDAGTGEHRISELRNHR